MNNTDTLSVDPGRTTLGALHTPSGAGLFRMSVNHAQKKDSGASFLDVFFATKTMSATSRHPALLLLRWALAAIMIVSGCFILTGEIYSPVAYVDPQIYAIVEITAGALLALGLFTRLAMTVAVAGFATFAIVSTLSGIFNLEALVCCMACMVFLVAGAGKYSCDFLLRKAMLKRESNRRREIKKGKLTYRAFRYASQM